MYKKTCFIIEDSVEDLALLLSFIEKTDFLKVVGTTGDYSEAVSYLINNHVDLLFLDIKISNNKGLNGLDILRTISEPPNTIIVSSFGKFAVGSYEVGAASDYLLKPYDFDRYLLAINRAFAKGVRSVPFLKEKTIFFKLGRKYQKFNLDDILFFEAYGVYIKVYTDVSKKPQVINDSLRGVLENLDKNAFIRIHKSFVINVTKVTSFDSNHIFVNNFPVPVGVSYKSKVDYLVKLFVNLE